LITTSLLELKGLEQLRWSDHDVALGAVGRIFALDMFHDDVVLPALRALEDKIFALEHSENEAERVFGTDNYAELRHATLEGFLLATQAAWERGLRALLLNAARRAKWGPQRIGKLTKVPWAEDQPDSMQSQFEALLGQSLSLFGCYEDLRVLHLFGNALRHGDGRSAEELHDRCPSLWMHWLPPAAEIAVGSQNVCVPADTPVRPCFDSITLKQIHLEQMMMAVRWFWEDVEFVRCNSFQRKAKGVEEHIAELRDKRRAREIQRVWQPS
jgi:hypothetical protein